MRVVVQKVYKFEELSTEVQTKVVDRYRYMYVDSVDWWNYTCEDFMYTLLHEYGFNADEDSVSFSLDDADKGAGFTGTFDIIEYAIKIAKHFDTEDHISDDVLDEIRKYGEVRVSQNSWNCTAPREWNTYIELLIDGIPMEEDEKYAAFVDALESWRKEECQHLYENTQDAYEYYTCDNYIRIIKKLSELPAEQVVAAFVYDNLTECGIEEGLYAAKHRKIGWVKKEDGNYIHSLKELCMWVLSSRFFTEVPTTIIESVDIEEFGIHLLEGNTLFLYDDDKKRVRTHTGQYYIHNNLILYHLGM